MASLFKPDNFARNWIGYVGNQSGHLLTGATSYVYLHVAYLWKFETLAYRWHVTAICLVGYLIWEAVINEWAGWDSVEDTVFFAGYGAGIPSLCVLGTETVDGVSLDPDLGLLTCLITFVWFHLCVGMFIRWKNERAA